jgi:D-3-phosphoglycerate dehydrogenase
MARAASSVKVAIVGTRYASLDIEEQALAPLGAGLVSGWGGDPAELVRLCRGCAVVMAGNPPRFTRAVLGALPELRGIVRSGIGVDSIDLRAAAEMGKIVCNVPDYCLDEVSTHAVTLILALNRHVLACDRIVREGGWSFDALRPLQSPPDQTAGIVGLGQIGRRVARKLGVFGFRLLGYDPYVAPAQVAELGVRCVDLDVLLAESDYITLHSPLTPETRHMIGAAQLARMKPTAYLVNTARGALVDEVALATALEAGTIRGAALDVLEQEPPGRDSPLLRHPRVVLTPHVAWYTERAEHELRRKSVEEAIRILEGRPPLHPVRA